MKISEIANFLNLEFNGCDKEIAKINSLSDAKEDEISYCYGNKNLNALKCTKAACVLISKDLYEFVPKNVQVLICENSHLSFAKLSKIFMKPLFAKNLLPATIDSSAEIHPSAFVSNAVTIGKKSIIMPNVFIGENVIIGDECIIYPGVVIYNHTEIGNRCIIHANSVIGSDGFGYAHTKTGEHVKIYHNGNTKIEDDVEIGACTTVDRGVFGSTIIKKGSKIDNLVQIAHNCILGENCIIVSQAGLAGSTILGRNVVMGGQSGCGGHISVGDFAQIAARGGVSKSLAGNKNYAGHPILELKDWLKLNAKIIRFFKKD